MKEDTEKSATLEEVVIEFRETAILLEGMYPKLFNKYNSPHRFEGFFVHRIEQSFDYMQKTRMYLGDCLRLIQASKKGENPRLDSFRWTPPAPTKDLNSYSKERAFEGASDLTEKGKTEKLKFNILEFYATLLDYTEEALASDGANLNDDSPEEGYSKFEFTLYWHSALQHLKEADQYLGLRLVEL